MATPRQFRFYNINSEQNYNGGMTIDGTPIEVNYNTLVNGNLFQLSEKNPAFQIGIQALPGTKFYLNSGLNNNNAIVVGLTGIYELNTEKIGINITNLQFDGQSILNINNNSGAYLIVDIIYEN